jgi:hypothetical protein
LDALYRNYLEGLKKSIKKPELGSRSSGQDLKGGHPMIQGRNLIHSRSFQHRKFRDCPACPRHLTLLPTNPTQPIKPLEQNPSWDTNERPASQRKKKPDPLSEQERSFRTHKHPLLEPTEVGTKVMLANMQPLWIKFLNVRLTAHSEFSGHYKITGL